MINSVLSRHNAKFCTFNIINFYLGTPLDRPEYIRIRIIDIPQEFITEYELTHHVRDGWVYFQIVKVIYSLPLSGILANKHLDTWLSAAGYYQLDATPGLWRHKWQPVMLTIIIDDFRVEYVCLSHAHHLCNVLQTHYKITQNWKGNLYAGINLTWNYSMHSCPLTMKEYIMTLLFKYNYPLPKKCQLSPFKATPIVYGAKTLFSLDPNNSPPRSAKGIKHVQGIVGALLYYARAVDNKLLHMLSDIGTEQKSTTCRPNSKINQLLDYCATYPNDGITYRSSDLILSAHSNAAYHNASKSRSHVGAHIMCSENDLVPSHNGPVLTIAQIIKLVMSSAAAKLAALFICAKEMFPLCHIEQSIRYLHAAAGFPTKSTWLAAIRKGNYSTWPLITVKSVHKHFPQSEETQQGHMRNQRQGTRSTKQALPQAEPRTPLPQLHDIFIRTYDTHGTLYTDQTGKFPHLSSQGNRYQMILYHVDSNSIWAEPTKNKTEGELILARNRALQRMKACGIQPTRQVLDNEISAAYKLAITASGMTYQLVPPGDHRRNIAEKAIQTWKDHFIAVISGTGAKFPLHLWCQLLPQMERQLCLLRQSNAYPTFPPIRISTAIMTTTHTLSSPWAWKPLSTTNPTAANLLPNTAPRGMSSAHPTSTTAAGKCGHQPRTTRISATVFFKHKYITNPSVTPAGAIIAAAANLSHLLTNNLQAHHNNKVNQSDLTRLQILTQPSPPPQHNATHYQQHSPNATHPSSPAAVSDYDSDSSDSDDESITIPHPVPGCLCNLQGVSAPPSSRHTTRAVAHIQSHRKPSYTCSTTPEHRSHHGAQQPGSFHVRPSQPYSTPTLENSSSIATSSKPKVLHHMEKCIWQRTRSPRPRYPGTVKGTNTIVFIAYNEIPPQRRKGVTYGRIVANYRPRRKTLIAFDSQLAVTGSLTLATAAHQQLTCSPPRFSSTASSPQRSTVHDHRHQGFLPQHTNGSP
eukprot:CCRYP_003151-RA/>CCRYP_003151-RA protein AED:0.23 eAED:0.28 QI:0/0/0/1/0/0/3/0/973